MPANPFKTGEVARRGLFSKLLRRADTDGAIQELRNLLAIKDPASIANAEVDEVLLRHHVSSESEDTTKLAIYSEAFTAFLSDDGAVSPDERRYLNDLARAIAIAPGAAAAVELTCATSTYRKLLATAVEDEEISHDEIAQLEALQRAFGLGSDVRASANRDIVAPILQQRLNQIMGDRRVTDHEYLGLQSLAEKLNVKIELDPKSQEMLELFRYYARIEAGELPERPTALGLASGELCHHRVSAQWAEMRTNLVRIDYASGSTTFRIAKGVSFRLGSVAPRRVTREELRVLDEGELNITSRRVIFRGARGNKALPFKSILGFEVYSDGLKIDKATGRAPFLLLNECDLEETAVILGAALRHA